MEKMKSNMNRRLQELKEEEIMSIKDYMSKLSATGVSNRESLQKIKSNLDIITQNVSKLDSRLSMEKEIYSNQ
eukprot:6804270-Ditylum_brightwellii.AAC.1